MMKFFNLFAVLIFIFSNSLAYAHGSDNGADQRKKESQEKEEKKDEDKWNDFMKAINKQNKPTSPKE